MSRVLLFRPNSAVAGGVVNYYSIILGKLAEDIAVDEFLVGRRAGLLGSKLLYPVRFFLDCLRLIVLALTREYDVYHFNPSLNRSAYVRDAVLVFILHLFRRNSKVLVFFRGWEEDYFKELVSHNGKRKRFIWFLNRASRILVLASTFQEKLVQLGVPPEKIAVTSTTFDGSLLQAATGDKNANLRTFLFMSRLIDKKGIFELVDAVRILKSEGYDFRLLVAGSGPSENAVKDIVKKNDLGRLVKMSGYLRDTAKAEAIVTSDVFVLPTYHGEGCPNCILEAMGAGLPIITTRVGGIPDIVKEPDNGILLESVTPENIAGAMRKFIEQEDLLEAVSKRNKSQAWELYESGNVARYLGSVYNRIAAQG